MKRFVVALVFVGAALSQDLDVLIRGGKLVDGTGNPWRMADIGIRAGRIAEVGELKSRKAAKMIDASGSRRRAWDSSTSTTIQTTRFSLTATRRAWCGRVLPR